MYQQFNSTHDSFQEIRINNSIRAYLAIMHFAFNVMFLEALVSEVIYKGWQM